VPTPCASTLGQLTEGTGRASAPAAAARQRAV